MVATRALRFPVHAGVRTQDLLGEVNLCFTITHQGVRHECIMITYVWPDVGDDELPEADGLSLKTRYTFRGAASTLREVVAASRVLYRAPLVQPPPFRAAQPVKEFWVLNDDMYRSF